MEVVEESSQGWLSFSRLVNILKRLCNIEPIRVVQLLYGVMTLVLVQDEDSIHVLDSGVGCILCFMTMKNLGKVLSSGSASRCHSGPWKTCRITISSRMRGLPHLCKDNNVSSVDRCKERKDYIVLPVISLL